MWKMPWYDIIYLYKAYSDYVDEENEKNEQDRLRIESDQEDIRANAANYNSSFNTDFTSMKNSMMSQMPKF